MKSNYGHGLVSSAKYGARLWRQLSVFFLLNLMLYPNLRAQIEHPLEVIGSSYTEPATSRGHLTLRNKSSEEVICTVKIKGIIVGTSGGHVVRARQEADPVIGFVIKPGREADLSFDFSGAVKKMRLTWNDPAAILSEVDENSLVDECKALGSTVSSNYYIFSNTAVFGDSNGSQEIFRLKLNQPSQHVESISFSGDGRLLAFAGDAHVELFQMPGHKALGRIDPEIGFIRFAQFTPNGRYLLITESTMDEQDSSWIRVYDWQAGSTVSTVKLPGNQLFPDDALAISPDSLHIATTDQNSEVRILSLPDLVWETSYYVDQPGPVAYSPDGQYLAVGSYADKVSILFARDGRLHREINEQAWIQSLAFTPDSSQILVGSSHDRRLTARLWSIQTASVLHTYLDLPRGNVDSVSIAPDGSKVLVSYYTWNNQGSSNPHQGDIFSLNAKPLGTVAFPGSGYQFTPRLP